MTVVVVGVVEEAGVDGRGETAGEADRASCWGAAAPGYPDAAVVLAGKIR